jgi:hypothetical protein
MNPVALPEDLRRFILTSIASVPHLEALLLLRAVPDQDWNSQAVAWRLYIGERAAHKLLEDLSTMGALEAHDSGAERLYRYGPRRPELVEIIDRLAASYAADLVGITKLIHSKLDRQAQLFADAFTWRKDV